MRGLRAPFQAPSFGRLLAGYTINQLGDRLGVVALAVLVYGETGNALATSALFVAAQFAPAFLAPACVARLDRAHASRALAATYATEAVLFAGLAVLAAHFSLVPVLILALVDGVLMLTARALIRASINATLEPRGLVREGNGLVNTGFAVAGAVGAALGGLIVEAAGTSAALAIDAASFAVVAVVMATARGLPQAVASAEGVITRMRAGLGYAWRHPQLRLLLGGQALAFVLFTLIVPIEVIYARKTLGSDERGFGLLLATWGAGQILGSIVFLRISHRRPTRLAAGAALVIGLAYVGMGLVTHLVAACAFCILGGLGNGVQWVALITAVQELTPADFQARIVGLLESLAAAMLGVGYLLGGVIVAVASPPLAFEIAGGGIVAGSVAALAVRPRRPPAAPSGAA